MKKVLHYMLIVVTGVLVLAHAVIPHHHHAAVFTAMVERMGGDVVAEFNKMHEEHFHHQDFKMISSFDKLLETKSFNHLSKPSCDIRPFLVGISGEEPLLDASADESKLYSPPDCALRSVCMHVRGLRAPPLLG